MMLRVPDTLTADRAENYAVSIRLWPGGLSFAGHVPSEKESFFFTETAFDRVKPYPQALKDVFFEHAFFSYPYRHVHVVCANRTYTLVPEPVFVEERKEELMSFVFSLSEHKILHEPLTALGAEIVYALPEEVYAFCSRSLIRPQFIHAVAPTLLRWRKQNLPCIRKQLYVSVHENSMDAACYDKGTLLFLNSFDIDGVTDILYYILYIWKHIGIDQAEGQLLLSAAPPLYRELKEMLQKYVNHVAPAEPPRIPTGTVGTETAIPPDIISLFE
ncbi:MAG: DUF3822 family protein [Tannerella sp.]|jgi:hypothetical protein|nr:DUF3822 family protein [Tannerella sp.]